MKKEFNIIDRYVERVAECFLRSECAKFIEYFFEECGLPKDKVVMDDMANELYKGSTLHNEDNKLIVTFKFPRE